MPLMLVYRVCDCNAQEERACECDHEGYRYHCAAMSLVRAALTRGELDIALLTVYVWFRSQHARDRFDNRARCIRDRRRGAGRSVSVFVGVREKFNIVVLSYCSILRTELAIIPRDTTLRVQNHLQLMSTRKECVD
jgi:hypothetical protein